MAEDKKLKQPDVPAKAESTAVKKGKDGKPIVEDELSEEDAELKNNLEMLVERVKESNLGVQNTALEALRKEIRTSTSSMTSVPKPLKFLRPHYDGLKEVFGRWPSGANKTLLADVISLLAMTMSKPSDETPESLKYRLLGSAEEIGSWGHEYVRNLAGEIGSDYQRRQALASSAAKEGKDVSKDDMADLLGLVEQIVPFHMLNNAEPEAVDLLLEVESLSSLAAHCDANNYSRTCQYLLSCSAYLPEPEDSQCLEVAYEIYLNMKKYPEAMRVALRLSCIATIERTLVKCKDKLEKRQLAFMLARQGVVMNLEDPTLVGEDQEVVQEIATNSKLSEHYLALARDLDVMEAKTPEDIYKSHLVEGRTPSNTATDSARHNLATTFVNAFVNAGFGHDKLMTAAPESSTEVSWIFKNKEHGKMSATASLGMVLMWDVEGGLPQIDKYLYSTDNHVVAGALLSVGVLNTWVRNECDPAYALLYDSVSKENAAVRIGAIQGLGLAYAGTAKEDVAELLCPLVCDEANNADVFGFAALTLGLVFVGTAHPGCTEAICQALLARPEADLENPLGRLAFLGLGLLFLKKQAAVEATVEIIKTLNPKVAMYAQLVLESCAYCGSGNVLKVQQFLSACSEHIDKESDEYNTHGDSHQGVAVMGIALVALAEELGAEMAVRTMEHLLQYGEPAIRRAVPLALALLSVSDPKLTVCDTLGRLSHDADEEVAMAAVLSLGLVSAGTNNARVASQLRQLSSYYYKEPSLLFLLRVAQGLTHMGKGLLTLNPHHSDRLLSPTAVAGLLATMFCCLDMKATVLAKYHHVLFYLTAAMQPRMLMTLDEDMRPLPVSVRVGQAVDVVGQAGRPKTITGFQTHTTPVLLATGDRAELATEQYIAVTPILEGCIILKPNPDYIAPTAA
eukprot:CAMPEP_0114250514 /NCGR_PEP_ID=MMETSP0058-20121206/14741_1 /TAXON_ID=36894 /ORGANISM="Pyramimonas parkeae, CCMP726" /LENGTH=908 /DNA_ID=CAMNT_0001364181 /DNA_START=49 /DNA_END=2775 /DNA_ORIENTATION=-